MTGNFYFVQMLQWKEAGLYCLLLLLLLVARVRGRSNCSPPAVVQGGKDLFGQLCILALPVNFASFVVLYLIDSRDSAESVAVSRRCSKHAIEAIYSGLYILVYFAKAPTLKHWSLSLFWLMMGTESALCIREDLSSAAADYAIMTDIFCHLLFIVISISGIWLHAGRTSSRRRWTGGRQLAEPLLDGGASERPRQLGGFEMQSAFQRLLFMHIEYVMKLGARRSLELQELPLLGTEEDPQLQYQAFKKIWNPEKRLLPALMRYGWVTLVLTLLASLLAMVFECGVPLVMKRVLDDLLFVKDGGSRWPGVVSVTALVMSSAMSQVLFVYSQRLGGKFGVEIQTLVMSAIYEKSLSINMSEAATFSRELASTSPDSTTRAASPTADGTRGPSAQSAANAEAHPTPATSGAIVNLTTVDAEQLPWAIASAQNCLTMPLQVGVQMVILYHLIGWPAWSSIIVILICTPIAKFVFDWDAWCTEKSMTAKDHRLKVTGEFLAGLRAIKTYVWERDVYQRLHELRANELKYVWKVQLASMTSNILWELTPVSFALVTMGLCAWADKSHQLTTATILAAFAILRNTALPLTFMPLAMSAVSEGRVALKRMERYFALPVVCSRVRIALPSTVDIIDADIGWPGSNVPVLRGVHLRVKPGSHVVVTGRTGSGKSTLIAALIGDLRPMVGSISISRNIGFADQLAWLQNTTILGNIVFGEVFDADRYDQVLEATGLKPDIATFVNRDQTVIGEKGVTLSGGQKQRVALARALYKDAEVYIFDDIFSAVDTDTANLIFERIFRGMLVNRTVLMVTHRLEIVKLFPNIGVIDSTGHLTVFRSAAAAFQHSVLREMVKESDHTSPTSSSSTKTKLPALNLPTATYRRASVSSHSPNGNNQNAQDAADETTPSNSSTTPRSSSNPLHPPKAVSDTLLAEVEKRYDSTDEEDVELGVVSWMVYKAWVGAAGGVLLVSTMLFAFLSARVISILSQFWLAYWAGLWQHPDLLTTQVGFGVYSALNILYVVGIAVSSLIMAICSQKTGAYFHDHLVRRFLGATMHFAHTTPKGRMLNRLSKDLETIDRHLPFVLSESIQLAIEVSAMLFSTVIALPPAAIVLPFVAWLYLRLQHYYVSTSRQLSRLSPALHAPVISLLSETLDGGATIRAFNKQRWMIGLYFQRQINHLKIQYLQLETLRWLEMRLTAIMILVSTSIPALCLMYAHSVNIGIAGLVITYANTITGALSWLVKVNADRENNIVSVERIVSYDNPEICPQERSTIGGALIPDEKWPQRGTIDFRRVKLTYREGLPPAIADVTFSVQAGTKLGIVGRTGSGKTTLMNALLRLIEMPPESQILIDGFDIQRVPLERLRAAISVIPQEPTLFSGNLRDNLDPFGRHSDEEMWEAIKKAHLPESFGGSLDSVVDEGGSNFSVGQRQLICLARVLLEPSRILLLDEATSSVDSQTDALIQRCITEEFRQSTVLTIAHRINTVEDYDMIAVMHYGKLVEYGPPQELMKIEDGVYRSLAVHG